ncbi:MAG: response regulator transcription factor [Chitinophagaceae bacterium]|nr:MAG: response regulator transcription factor [Chitinophagaceae bacterium]
MNAVRSKALSNSLNNMEKSKKILLVDDHEIIRNGLSLLIKTFQNNATVDEAGDGTTALRFLRKKQYDLLILDVFVPGMDIFQLLKTIGLKWPALRILIFSMTDESNYGIRFVKAGVKGFVNKSAPSAQLEQAIKTVLSGSNYYSPDMVDQITRAVDQPSSNPFDKLSPKEFEVCVQLIRVLPTTEIARQLGLSPSTIATHKTRILSKLNVSNLVELNELGKHHHFIQ